MIITVMIAIMVIVITMIVQEVDFMVAWTYGYTCGRILSNRRTAKRSDVAGQQTTYQPSYVQQNSSNTYPP